MPLALYSMDTGIRVCSWTSPSNPDDAQMLLNVALVSRHKAMRPRNECVLDLPFDAMIAGWERTVLND